MSTLKEALDDINRLQCFGYGPTSSSTKPAHVANGWFRGLLGQGFDPVLLNQAVVQWSRKDGKINSPDDLIKNHPGVFARFQTQSKQAEFAEFRSDLKALVSPFGGAVNNGNRNSVYNITCQQHVTSDSLDLRTGAFLSQLVGIDLGNGPSPAVKLLKDLLQSPRDEISTITVPLTSEAKATPVTQGTYPAPGVFKTKGRAFVSPILKELRSGFDHLARFETAYGGELDALRRLVALGVLGILLHMHNRLNELSGTNTLNPVLLYFPERIRNTAYQASHATYNLNRRAIESLYAEQLRAWLEPRVGKRPRPRSVEKYIKTLQFEKSGTSDKKNQEQISRSFKSFVGELKPIEALAEALRESLFRSMSGTPLDFYRGLGVRIGALRPSGNSAVRKYYTLEGVLLEAVLASILPDGEMPYQLLLDRMFEKYGLIVGGRPVDSGILTRAHIGIATVQDLQANSQSFRQHLISLGWGRQYADGVLMVRVPESLR